MSAGLESIGEVFQKMETDGYVIEWVLGDESASDLRSSLDDLESFFARVEADWLGADGKPGWSAEISLMLEKSEDVAETIQTIHDFIEANRGRALSIVDDLAKATDDARSVIADLRAEAPLWMADVGDALANVDLASQQLELLIAEARNAPWRLLYQPSEQQVTGELLYEASRNFVFGAADLKSAASSMEKLVASRGEDLDTAARDFKLVRDNLMNAVQRYERAQSQLSEVLSADSSSDK